MTAISKAPSDTLTIYSQHRTHLYLRASTQDQDSRRAQALLEAFAAERNLTIVGLYAENISGTKLDRPELNKLLSCAQAGEVLLVESVDRLSRLSQADWDNLKATIKAKGLRLVVADLPTSHQLISDKGIAGQVMTVINEMLIDLMATMARLDQEKRVERIKQGIERKKEIEPGWQPPGKQKNTAKHAAVQALLKRNSNTIEEIAKLAEVGVATVYRIKAAMKAEA